MLSTDLADLKAHMAQNPGAVIEDVARERKVTPRAVIEALPPEMVRIGRGDAFADAMQDIAQWGEVTLIVHTDDAIFEFTGAIPAGEIGRGYFNLMQPKGLHGHFRHERCGGDRLRRAALHGQIVGVRRLSQRRWRHHVQGVRRPRRGAGVRQDQLERFKSLAGKIARRPSGLDRRAVSRGARPCSETMRHSSADRNAVA